MSAQAAAKAGNLSALTAALAAGAAVDAPWEDGNSALHEAAITGSVVRWVRAHLDVRCVNALSTGAFTRQECVKLLLAKGANVHARGRNDATPLVFAAGNATPEVLQLLHAAGADVNAVSKQGVSALMYAAIRGRPETTEWLLKHGADVRQQSALKQTALSLAAGGPSEKADAPNAKNYPVVAKLLLDAGAEVDSRDRDGWTPLYAAAACGESEIVKVLIAGGADVNVRDAGTGAMPLRATPLHQACAGRHAETVKVLLQAGAYDNVTDVKGRAPRMALPDFNDAAKQACEYYLNHAAELDESLGKQVSVLLKPSAGELDVQKVLSFFEGPKALDVNAPISRLEWDTPLSLISRWDRPTCCELARELIKRGAHVNERQGALGWPPLFGAASNGCVEMVKLLLQAGADVDYQQPGPYFTGFTALIECLCNAGQKANKRDDGDGGKYEKTAMELLAAGASTDNVLAKDPYDGWMPLHFAVQSGYLRPTQAIMERGGPGANVYAKAGWRTAMIMAEGVKLRTGDSSIEDYLKSVAPPPPPPQCIIS